MNLYIEIRDLTLKFKVLDTPVAQSWVTCMSLRDQYPLDHPKRFYGFNTQYEEKAIALSMIQHSVDTINNYSPVITKQLTSVDDQDTLNYLHSIFEQYHGLLDCQNREFFINAPQEVKQALADLNINVHRCESVVRGNRPRFVCTWYGLPKTETLPVEVIKEYGILNPKFGTVCLNYCEIGKTLEDLTLDRDNYISDKAFLPFNHFSADFNVKMYEESEIELAEKLAMMETYFKEHISFFQDRGYSTVDHPRLLPLRFPVAQLVETMPREQLLKEIQQRQQVTKVIIE